MKRPDTARPPSTSQRWRDRLAWLLPLLTTGLCTAFFVGISMRADWLARPAFGASLSRATVVAGAILLLMIVSVVAFALLAERADRDGGDR